LARNFQTTTETAYVTQTSPEKTGKGHQNVAMFHLPGMVATIRRH
jgi:hypothetical protein